jgi:hypothetical protein
MTIQYMELDVFNQGLSLLDEPNLFSSSGSSLCLDKDNFFEEFDLDISNENST